MVTHLVGSQGEGKLWGKQRSWLDETAEEGEGVCVYLCVFVVVGGINVKSGL